MSLRPVGVISNYTVIESVGRTLASLLKTEMEHASEVIITIASPGEDYGAPVNNSGEETGQSRVNLFLYRVDEPSHSRNNDWVDAGEGRHIPYPLTLNLNYMLNIFTPDRSSNLDEHRILGDVMRVFHANQIINSIYFDGTLNPNEPPIGLPWEDLKIIHHPLPLEELAAVWHAINKPYRLSVAYEVSAIQIAPPDYKSRRVRRVEVTHVKATPFKGRPCIQNISPERGYAKDLLTINGEGFESDFIKVYFNDLLIEPENIEATKITLYAPEKLPPGLYPVIVYNEEGNSEAKRFEEISPFLYRLDPDSKYTEDPDFPKNISGEPGLTIWGGNFLIDPPLQIKVIAKHESEPENEFIIASGLTKNSIKWTVPSNMRSGRTVLKIRQGGNIESNPLVFEIPAPQIYRVDPDVVSSLPQELTIRGDFFRSGSTELFLHKGELLNVGDLNPSEIVPITFKSEREIRTTLPASLTNGKYRLVVRVYGKYYSESYEIQV